MNRKHLNSLVATTVMGWHLEERSTGHFWTIEGRVIRCADEFDPTRNTADAALAVERTEELGVHLSINDEDIDKGNVLVRLCVEAVKAVDPTVPNLWFFR